MSYEIGTRVVKRKDGRSVVVYDDRAAPGLGSFDLISLADKIQTGADKIESNISTGTNWLNSLVQKINTGAATATNVANRVGAGVQGATRGGIAAAATGDASSGLALGALTTKPAVVIGGVLLAMWIFGKHPGKRGF